MKRVAEKQLTKDQEDEDDIEEVDPSQGFKKADETILAARPMRGLPKRGNVALSTPQPPSLLAPSPEKKDESPMISSGFKGFGSASSSPFTFTAPTSAPSSSPIAQASSIDSPFKFGAAAPISLSASPATKKFASFVGSSQSNGLLSATSPPTPSASAEEDATIKYLISIRGLNVAFRSAVIKAIDKEPLSDLGEFLGEYKSLRASIQKEYDDKKKPHSAAYTNGAPSPLFTSGSSSGTVSGAPKAAAPKLPAPPASFAGFGTPLSVPNTSAFSTPAPSFGGFKPVLNTPSTSSAPSPFSFGTPPTSSEIAPAASSPFTFSSLSTSAGKSSFFGPSDAPSDSSPFGSSVPATSSPSGSSKSTDKPPISVFGPGGVFDNASSTSKLGSTTLAAPAIPPSIFGSSGISSSTSAPTTSGSSGFSFGSKTAPKGNLGNPVGFSFGSNTTPPEPESLAASAVEGASVSSSSAMPPVGLTASTPAPSGFTVGAGPGAEASARQDTPVLLRDETPGSVDSSEAQTEGEASTPKVLGENPNDLEGEGEENEETIYTSRVKIYKFTKKDDQPHWAEVGVGMLRIKKHKEDESKRLLSRNSANGKIMINFKLYPGLKTTRTKQVLNFVGHEDGVNVTYRVRMKDEASTVALKDAIDKEVPPL